ncbi:MAG: hypothetical protein ACTSQP_17925 [Promethearchaeota archaeon]
MSILIRLLEIQSKILVLLNMEVFGGNISSMTPTEGTLYMSMYRIKEGDVSI